MMEAAIMVVGMGAEIWAEEISRRMPAAWLLMMIMTGNKLKAGCYSSRCIEHSLLFRMDHG